MRKLAEGPLFDETEDGFALLEGSIRVRPDEFPEVALAEDGSLLDFDVRAFYDVHVSEAIGHGPDDPPLRYDAFTSMTLIEAFTWLQERGHLAHRGNGESYDYWLACPAVRRS